MRSELWQDFVYQYQFFKIPISESKKGHTRSQGGGGWRGSNEPPPPWILKSTFYLNCDYQSPNWCQIWWKSLKISFEKQDFPTVWTKCLEIARLQDFAPISQAFWDRLSRGAQRRISAYGPDDDVKLYVLQAPVEGASPCAWSILRHWNNITVSSVPHPVSITMTLKLEANVPWYQFPLARRSVACWHLWWGTNDNSLFRRGRLKVATFYAPIRLGTIFRTFCHLFITSNW